MQATDTNGHPPFTTLLISSFSLGIFTLYNIKKTCDDRS